MTKECSLKQNNRGLSLIELIVTILMSALIMMMLVVFVSTSRKSYQVTQTEITLQEEAGYALGYIEDIAVEASYCSPLFEDVSDGSHEMKAFYIKAPDSAATWKDFYEDSYEDYYYIIVFDKAAAEETGNLRFVRVSEGDIPAGLIMTKDDISSILQNLESAGRGVYGNTRTLLSQYVNDINVIPPPDDSGIIDIEIILKLMDDTYVAHRVISGRNM